MRKPRGVVHVEQGIRSVCIIPAVDRRRKRCGSKLPNSQAAKGSRREHWQNVLPEARVLRCQGRSCSTDGWLHAGALRGEEGVELFETKEGRGYVRCPSKEQGGRQRRVGVKGTSSKCAEVQSEMPWR